MRILLVEDDKELCEAVRIQLECAGYDVDTCGHGGEALSYALGYPYDVMILDRMLPEVDGLSLLTAIRRKNIHTPVILTTALDGIRDRIDGLDAGADDYLPKPFAVEELLARIRALLRRPGHVEEQSALTYLDLSLDTNLNRLHSGERSVSLSKREAAVLEYFMRNPDRTLPRELILTYIWGPGCEVEDGNLDNYVYFLRRRLKAVQCRARIKTVHGVGYRLEETYD